MERLELLADHLDFRRCGVTTVLSFGLGVGHHGGGNAFALCIDRTDVLQSLPLTFGKPLQNARFGVVRLERTARTAEEAGQFAVVVGCVAQLNKMMALGADQKGFRGHSSHHYRR